ncbi:hypothetical protein R3Q06_32605 [Rhodococcus erythropolis]|uniref:hypothetical protein n=1 Tax=Rhodococcus erythropolis TaxID=1833 RepID=UPI00294A8BC0|nr:hypothetical protein [Rhodococcus erythropolis]MDV6278208.1 hypothetical protein [Rhodococcus erythropolis]
MTRSTTSRRHRLRKLAYAPLVAAVAAGTLCTGAGISTAADTTAPATTDTPQSGDAYEWALLNHTGQPIYGSWDAKMEFGAHSRVETDKDHPWKPDDAAKATQYKDGNYTTWRGHICFNEHWWDITLSGGAGWGDTAFGFGTEVPVFRLEADSAGTPWVYFDNYIFGIHYIDRFPLDPQSGSC